mmetsp:Transcript_28482/g.81908  ORF Transcript_28482/g.81908 Transcript_28482/m.81908 type:complete len:421 (+) Transcript_28482:48-1310(+)
MCRAGSSAKMVGEEDTARDVPMTSEDANPTTDPLATNLRHFHPPRRTFDTLPQGEFTMVRELAEGIHGDVFEYRWMWQGAGGKPVAVKKLRLGTVQDDREMERDDRSAHFRIGRRAIPDVEDALAEIGVFQHLAAQPDSSLFLLRLHGVFQDHEHAWLVTEFAEGGELFSLVSDKGALSEPQAKRFTWQMLQATAFLHSHSIAHRDISLENLLLKDDTIRLMDFGMAVQSRTADGVLFRYFRPACKDFYRAPECTVPSAEFVDVTVPAGAAPGDVVCVRACGAYWCEVLLPSNAMPNCTARAQVYGYVAPPVDIFAAGVCLFIMLVRNPPWHRASLSDNLFRWVMERNVVELLVDWGLPPPSAELSALLKAMTSADPAQRWSVDKCLSCEWLAEFAATGAPAHLGNPSRAPNVLRTLAGA